MKTLLFLVWLLFAQTLAFAQLVAGVALAFGASAVQRALGPHAGPRRIRLASAARLAAVVACDIVRSNIAVARIVFAPERPGRRAGFVPIPLDTRHSGALAALAIIVTATPGTSWAGYDPERNVLTLHVLDLHDEEDLIRSFKARYERRLQEIFE
ncbi:MAG TPA: Na+/H+ antiporter subunit E [Burkholderiales bacterium]|nr:Na+/H+ antiporter subunit E [Burkholderiales bacterium]